MPSPTVFSLLNTPRLTVNSYLDNVEPWKIVVGSAGAAVLVTSLYNATQHRVPLTARIKKSIFRWMRKLPAVQRQISTEMGKVRENFEEEFGKAVEDVPYQLELSASSKSAEEVLEEAKFHLSLGDLDWENGAMSGTVYNSNKELGQLTSDVYTLAAWTNPLHPDAFPGLRKMEAEVVRMVCDIFHGGPESVGVVTTGGTESITLACKTYRDLGREEKGVEVGEILCCVTAHAAFDKAAAMLGMRLRHVPVDPVTMRLDVAAMRSMISSRTVMLVGSACQFPHGSIDDIEAIGALGLRYNIPVHVDACLGGFVLAFMDDAGYPVQPFDFRVPGVTSLSADTHKYGYAPKGSSLVMYRSSCYRDYQWFCFPDWPGGIYGTPTIAGSRAGGIIAACWAALKYHGREGYVEATREIVTTTRKITEGVRATPGLKIVGVPEVCVVAFTSDQFNIYGLSDEMKARGWALNSLQYPACVHIAVTRSVSLSVAMSLSQSAGVTPSQGSQTNSSETCRRSQPR